MKSVLKTILSSCLVQMKQSFARSMFRFCILVYPILFGFTLYMMYKDRGPVEMVSYVMLGTAVGSMWGSISFSSAGDIDRERYMGTLELIFSTPSRFITIMLGKVLGNTILGLFSMAVSFVFISLCFQIPITIQNPVFFFLALAISALSFMAVAMLLSACLTISRNTRALMNCIDYPIYIFCGLVFPIEILPIWTRPISYMLSPTYGVKLLRMAIVGITDMGMYWFNMVGLIVTTLIYTVFTIYFYEVIDKRARIQATLEVY